MLESLRPDPTFHPTTRLAMQAERERFCYTALLSRDRSRPDALAVVDLDAGSATYGQVLHRLDMPNVGDEVVLAFDQGHWDHPCVIGYMWNPQQRPPSTDERQRMIRSKNGHTIRFVDCTPTGGNRGTLIVQDAHDNVIVMTNGRVVIHSKGALEIRSDGEMTLQGRLVKRLGGPI